MEEILANKQKVADIYWKTVRAKVTYLYGSQISFKEGQAHFYNPRLASGKPIVTFTSRTNYQSERYAPDLPLLIQGRDYRVTYDIQTVPDQRFLLQFDFFNRQGEQVAYAVVRTSGDSFTYPQGAFTYRLSVISAGCSELVYRTISLYEDVEVSKEQEDEVKPRRYMESMVPESLSLVKGLINYM